MKEKHLMIICVAGLFLCIAALYFFTTSMSYSVHVNIGDIGKDWAGKDVNMTGKITNLRRSGGNIFFDIYDETGKIKVVLWNSTLELMEAGGANPGEIRNGKSVNIVGSVEIYKGEVEVIPTLDRVKFV
jgi:DNA/RNA endonuclease YhcR with UshA esterase domain